MKVYLLAFIAIATLFTSCKKNNDNNAASGVAFHLKTTNTSATFGRTTTGITVESGRITGVNVEWTSGVASADMLKFEAKQAGQEIEFKSSVQRTIDLFDANASLGNISIPPGTYDEIEFKSQLSPAGANPALELKGKLTSGTVVTPVIFRANEIIMLKGEKHNVTVNPRTIHNASTTLNLTRVMKDITATDLDNAVRTSGEILITSTVNSSLYNIIVKNLRHLEDEEEWH